MKTRSSPQPSIKDSTTGKSSKTRKKRSVKSENSGTTTTGRSRQSATASNATNEESGKRVGTKRSDRRWQAPDGSIWASKFEWRVFDALVRHFEGNQWISVERCGQDCTLGYHSTVKSGRCQECGSVCVVQERTYTPDIRIVRVDKSGERQYTYIEAKGYFEGSSRNLFRQVLKTHEMLDIRLVAERDHPVTKGKTRLSDWARRFKVRFHLWENGKLLEENWL